MEKAQTGIQETRVWGLGHITRELCDYGQLSSPTCPRKITRQCWIVLEVPLGSWTPWHNGFVLKKLSFPLSSIHPHLPPPTPNLLMIRALEGYLWCPICWDTARERIAPATCALVYFILDAFQRAGGSRRGRERGGLLAGSVTSIVVPLHMQGLGPSTADNQHVGKPGPFTN